MTTLYRQRRTSVSGLVALLLLVPGSMVRAQGDEIRVLPPGAGRTEILGDSTSPRLEIKELTVGGRRVDIREILRKAVDGERRKYAGLETMAFTRSMRIVVRFPGKKARTEIHEIIRRVYFRSPDRWVEATVLDTTWSVMADGSIKPPEEGDEDAIMVEVNRRNLEEIPYYLERLDKFRFFQGDIHRTDSTAVFEIPFEPKSDFDELPGGRLWLLAPRYQIVREQFVLTNLPAPWALKKLDLLTREWQPIEDRWLEKRITGRVDLTSVVQKIGGPSSIEFVMTYGDYRLDPELDPSIFDRGDE
ncbi:MAG: hypothetical protein FD129_1068 [bacterium]|nr:MAG: hypothetical protein FD129_1068 [bacterium]